MRVLFISSTRIGDAVLTSGALAWALERWPRARVTIACGAEPAPLFEAVPRLDRVIVIRKRKGGRHWFDLWRACAATWWTAIIDLRRSAMTYSLAARHRFVLGRSDEDRHKVERVTAMLRLPQPVAPVVWTAAKHDQAAADLIEAGGPVLAVAPTANWGGKEWPIDRFVDLCTRLTSPGAPLAAARVAVFTAPAEAARAAPLVTALPLERVIDLRGRTDLLTAYACLKRATLFIGNDSALMHLAAASGIPTLGLFGPSLERVYGPWGANTAVVRTTLSFDDIINAPGYDHKSHETRMATLSVDRVHDAALGLLQSAPLVAS